MAEYAIGTAFHKASRTIIRAVEPSSPRTFVSTRDARGFIIPPSLGAKEYYVELQGITQVSFQVNDNVEDIRIFADEGWTDGSVISSTLTASVTAFFLRDLEYVEGWAPGVVAAVPPNQIAYNNGAIACSIPDRTSGAWERGFRLITNSRYQKDIGQIASDPTIRNNRIYVEILKEIGREDGTPDSDLIYDFVGFECMISNYQETDNPDGLTEISYDLISVAAPSVGKYTAGTKAPPVFDDWNYSDFRDAITKDSICKFGPEFTAIIASNPVEVGVLNCLYNQVTGDARLLLSGVTHIGVGRTVRLFGLYFGCFSNNGEYNATYFPRPQDPNEFIVTSIQDKPLRETEVRQATYNNVTGLVTLTIGSAAGVKVGEYISVSSLRFTCDSSGQPQTKVFPQETSDSYFPVLSVANTVITFNAGPSTIVHTYVGGGSVITGPEMRLNIGPSTLRHFYINGGQVTVVRPTELVDGTLTYNNADVRPRVGSIFTLPVA